MDAETAHKRVLSMASKWPRTTAGLWWGGPPPKSAASTFLGEEVPSPVGLAAGMDKEGEALLLWERLGFGHIEVGTVTPRPQPGNPTPRIWRVPADRTVVNAMGFPSSGAEAVAKRLTRERELGRWPSIPVGFNLGKNKETPLDEADKDYEIACTTLRHLADYFTVNVSSPNTPDLRKLQNAEAIRPVLATVIAAADGLPVLLKLSPDLDPEVMRQTVEVAISEGAAGIIATNTTTNRPTEASQEFDRGGLSGAPLYPISRDVIANLVEMVNKRIEVVGVGGICGPDEAKEYLALGCGAVQVLSGMVFEGPGLVNKINRAL